MAIGGPTVTSVQDALEAGVFVVAAAGNQGENSSDVSTPASIRQVIAVGAIDRGGIVWEDTSKGAISMDGEIREDPHKKPEISAPGLMSFLQTIRNLVYLMHLVVAHLCLQCLL